MALPPYVSFVRNLWLSFLVYTAANVLLYWGLTVQPWATEEIGIGRALVFVIALCTWIVGLILAIGFWKWALARTVSDRQGRILSLVLWVLALTYTGLVLMETSPWKSVNTLDFYETRVAAQLKSMSAAQADLRTHDRDGNKIQDYWVGDVSGLYRLPSAADHEPIKLLMLGIAMADASPVETSGAGAMKPIDHYGVRGMHGGYWYRALTFYVDRSGKAVRYHDGGGRNPDRFGFCAYPGSKNSGTRMLIVSEGNRIFWKKYDGTPPETFPADPLKEGWTAHQ